MKKEDVELTEEELETFKEFYEEHSECNLDEVITLSNLYHVKLILNVGKDNIVKTCLCSLCGAEDLISNIEDI